MGKKDILVRGKGQNKDRSVSETKGYNGSW